ncbi:MAG: DUF1002 domain-containing protein [Lachnospiraceae bacterium]
MNWRKWIATGMAVVCCLLPVTQTYAEVSGGFSADDTISSDETEASDADVSDNTDQVTIDASDKPYLALGENLTQDQKNTVLALMGIAPADLGNYDVQYVTNQEEHEYLGDYISADKIGTKALSSIVIAKKDKGSGLNISTYNISYCTVGMYKNALVTAGVEDADIIVAGPFPISGTAALVGIIKAYQEITGEEMPKENIDTALNEMVVTGSIEAGDAKGANKQDSQQVENYMAYVKQKIADAGSNSLSQEEIEDIVKDAQSQFDLSLTDEQLDQVAKLMGKVKDLDIDSERLKQQASEIYDKIAALDEDGSISNWFQSVWEAIKEFFVNLLS